MRPREIANEQEVATRYVSLIKSRFANDKNYTYNQFMSILQDYQSGRKDMRSVIQQVDAFKHSDPDRGPVPRERRPHPAVRDVPAPRVPI